jgi:polyhydroxyalkanoate synthesis regulator phasin
VNVQTKIPDQIRNDKEKHMSPDEIREDIELQIVELIKKLLADGSITDERAQQLSQRVLDVLTPGLSMEQLYQAIPKLDDTTSELAPIVVPFMREYEENVTKQAQQTVSELIRQGQYDAATKLSQKVIDKKVELTWSGSGKPQ